MPYLMVGKRAKEMAAVAPRHNFEYLEREAFGLTRRPLSLFCQGDGHEAENLIVGRIRGVEVYGFDYPYLSGPREDVGELPPGFPNVRYEQGNQYGCVLVPTDADFPMVFVTRRSRRGLLASGVETPVAVENKQFKKLFHVWSSDPAFLQRLLTPPVVDLLVRTDGRFTFEVFGDSILCLDRVVRPEEFPPLMALTVSLREQMAPELFDAYKVDEIVEQTAAEGSPGPIAPAASAEPGEHTWF
jgi:hypothetical protein